mmetsp:Transcript_100899/g.140171  ORF Transcript_100899/g.140171 Transcript_100899/m.140171 type:complete len:213 (-) Transcript_100899:278-916(-)
MANRSQKKDVAGYGVDLEKLDLAPAKPPGLPDEDQIHAHPSTNRNYNMYVQATGLCLISSLILCVVSWAAVYEESADGRAYGIVFGGLTLVTFLNHLAAFATRQMTKHKFAAGLLVWILICDIANLLGFIVVMVRLADNASKENNAELRTEVVVVEIFFGAFSVIVPFFALYKGHKILEQCKKYLGGSGNNNKNNADLSHEAVPQSPMSNKE